MSIKKILDEISNESGSNAKMGILSKYVNNKLLKEVIYLAKSRKIKFYIKQIPEYPTPKGEMELDSAIEALSDIYNGKVSGHSAIEVLTHILSSVNEDDAYVIERVIEKDLKIGMGTSNINKVIKGLIEKTPYMGAKSYSEKLARAIFKSKVLIASSLPKTAVAVSQIKMDGRYCNAIINNGEVELVSRQGETTFVGDATFLKELLHFEDKTVVNGELTVDGVSDRYTANGIVASIVDIEGKREIRTNKETSNKILTFEKKHGEYQKLVNNIRFTVWDVISLDEYYNEKSKNKYEYRLDKLTKILSNPVFNMVSLVETKYVTSFKEGMLHFQDALKRGLEGTILKALDGVWKNGKPNHQVKLKLEMNLDLKVVGFEYGTKGTKNENVISTINLESSCGKLRTNASGMKEDMMRYVTDNQDKLLGSIVEIRCCGVSQNSSGEYSTLHPSVVELRDDKTEGNTLEECIQINNSLIEIK